MTAAVAMRGGRIPYQSAGTDKFHIGNYYRRPRVAGIGSRRNARRRDSRRLNRLPKRITAVAHATRSWGRMPVRATAGTNRRINALWRRLSKIVSPAARAATPPPPPSGCAGPCSRSIRSTCARSGARGRVSQSYFLAPKPRRDQRQHLRLLRTEPQTSVRAGGMRGQRSEHTLVVVRECPRAVGSQVHQTNDATFAGERKVHRGAQRKAARRRRQP